MQGNASPHCNPPGGFGLTCEITYSPHKPLPCDGEALIERCIDDCMRGRHLAPTTGSGLASQPGRHAVRLRGLRPRARANVAIIRDWLAHDIVLAGRYSEWEYYNSDHAFLAGRRAAAQVQASARAEQIAQSA